MIHAVVGAAVEAAVAAVARAGAFAVPERLDSTLVRPRAAAHGELASNAALALAKVAGQPPLALARAIATELQRHPAIALAQAAPPGFINLTFEPGWLAELPFAVLAAGEALGEPLLGQARRLVEQRLAAPGALLRGEVRLRAADGSLAGWGDRPHAPVTLAELAAAVGVDTARLLLIQRPEPPVDLGLARQESAENPSYYLRYTHARLASIARLAGAQGGAAAQTWQGAPLAPDERALLLVLGRFEGELTLALETQDPTRVVRYALELATAFHQFYSSCRVLAEDPRQAGFRRALVEAVRSVLEALLVRGLGLGAPTSLWPEPEV